MIENITMITFSIIMSMMVVFKPIKEIIIKKENVKKYKYELMLFVIIFQEDLIQMKHLLLMMHGLFQIMELIEMEMNFLFFLYHGEVDKMHYIHIC